MTQPAQALIDLPPRADGEDQPVWRYWGATKPPKNAAILCMATPRLNQTGTKATIRIYGPIDPWGGFWGVSAKEVAEALDGLDDSVTEIQLRINSPGGSCWEGLAILNMLRAHPAKVTAVVDGLAASAASFLACSLDATIMSPGTQMMIHDPWTSAWGCNADELRAAATVLDKIATSMSTLYAAKAGGKPVDWRAVMVETTWYTAEEAVEAKLADKVAVVPDAGKTTTAGADLDEDDEELEPDEDPDEPVDQALIFDFSTIAAALQRPSKPPTASADGHHHPEGGSAVAFSNEQMTTLRQKLGLPEDADEATIVGALDEALEERAEPPAAPTTVPDGMSLVDTNVLEELRAGATAGTTAQRTLAAQERDRELNAALAAGKIAATSKDKFAEAWDKDPAGTKAILDVLTPGLVPTAESGHSSEPAEPAGLDVADEALTEFAAQLGLTLEDLRV